MVTLASVVREGKDKINSYLQKLKAHSIRRQDKRNSCVYNGNFTKDEKKMLVYIGTECSAYI